MYVSAPASHSEKCRQANAFQAYVIGSSQCSHTGVCSAKVRPRYSANMRASPNCLKKSATATGFDLVLDT